MWLVWVKFVVLGSKGMGYSIVDIKIFLSDFC